MTKSQMEKAPDSVSGQISVKVFRSLEDIETLRWFWSSCPGLRNSDIDMFLTAQRISQGERPHVLGLYRGEKLDALLIGGICRRQLPLQVGYFTMQSPLVNIMTFPYGALRGNDNSTNCKVLIREVMKSLRNGEADLALLDHVKLDSDLFRYGRQEVGFLLRDRFSPVRPHWKRELPDNIDELQASLSSSARQRFRQIAKKLSNDFPGQVNLVKLGDTSDLERITQDVEEVAKKTWQRELGLGGFNTGTGLRAIWKTQAEMGWLRVYILYLGAKPCAFWAGAVYQKTFYSDYIGYDPDYARYSLGTYLLSRMLEDLCLDGTRAIDFGFTDDEYKRRFGNVMWHETSLHLFPATFKGLRLGISRGIAALISNSSRALLQRMGLLQRVKSVWRRVGRGVKREMVDSGPAQNSGEASSCAPGRRK